MNTNKFVSERPLKGQHLIHLYDRTLVAKDGIIAIEGEVYGHVVEALAAQGFYPEGHAKVSKSKLADE
jgi:hypothetical protein